MNDQGLAPGFWLAWAALLCLLAGGCCGDCAPEDSKRLLEFDSQGGDLGWEAGFADSTAREAYRITRPGSDGVMRTYPVFLVTARAV